MIYYIIGVILTYILFQAYDIYCYVKQVRCTISPSRKENEMKYLKEGVVNNVVFAFIFPVAWVIVLIMIILDLLKSLVEKISKRLE